MRCYNGTLRCGHYWGREIGKLGHDVWLIPPAYVKPFIKRQKNDMSIQWRGRALGWED